LNVEQVQQQVKIRFVRGQTAKEISEYQHEMIREEAHEIWLRRRVTGMPGDSSTDWEEAERHYFTNN